MASIKEMNCSASLQHGVLTLASGKTIDLGKIEDLLNEIAGRTVPESNDEEHDLFVDCLITAQEARDELCGSTILAGVGCGVDGRAVHHGLRGAS